MTGMFKRVLGVLFTLSVLAIIVMAVMESRVEQVVQPEISTEVLPLSDSLNAVVLSDSLAVSAGGEKNLPSTLSF